MLNSKGNKLFQTFAHIMLGIMVLLVLLPFVLVFMSSITDETSLITNGYSFFPKKTSIDAYLYILQQGGKIVRAYGITIFVTILGTSINLIMSTLMAYPLSLKKLPYRRIITFYVFFTMLFNGGLVPTYLMYTNVLHIKNTLFALIVPNLLLSAYNVLLIRTFLSVNIPSALYEAARMDGAGQFRILISIVLPLAKPILVTIGLFTGLAYWNDWTNGLYYLSGNEGQSLYGIQNLLNQMITNIQYLASGKVGGIGSEVAKMPAVSIRMAIAFVAMIPLLVLYPFLQKYFAKGITVGAVK
ncbi:carbohydrate ABC transporter permease [Vallitalea pronyensis]|uniref:Carbohydrate ABC transporter permease n=1 Tax=Vallitalea pronyensis TaxID=1348613 RepID=A0A8J8SI64_9FIRM|nr:carbohydrate ABC transporter permease [Vallitalea pronyensis]QUI24281.1 carbohydrate ABC transporter permease [Vallitalea pronyensis]